MAEGDTILRLARRIDRELAGRIVSARAPHPRGRAAGVERLDGAILLAALARGKHLLLNFRLPAQTTVPSLPSSGGLITRSADEDSARRDVGEGREVILHSHLAMSGGWHLYRHGVCWRRPERSAWVVISTSDGSGGGIDLVQFGGPTLRLLRPEQARRDPALTSLGPDILAPEPFDPDAVVRSLQAADQSTQLGEALLDQRLVAGIGNIFKSESCFAASLNPWRTLDQLSPEELLEVVRSVREMMHTAVDGTPRPRNVYRRAGEPCFRCGTRLKSRGQGLANRTTYWCPKCQV